MEARPVNAGLYMAFKHCISFANCNSFGCKLCSQRIATLVVMNLKSYQRLFPIFCAQSPGVTVLLDWNLSRSPVLGQVVNLDLLLCTGLDFKLEVKIGTCCLFLCPYFTQKAMSDQIKYSITRVVLCGSTFSQWKPVAASSDCLRLGTTLCCAPQSFHRLPAHHAVLECCPKSLAIDLSVKTFNFVSVTAFRSDARWPEGAKSWTQTWTLQQTWTLEPNQACRTYI